MSSILERLLAGEVLFLPKQDWHSVTGGKMYSEARRRGRYIHFHQSDLNGEPGLRVWVDDTPARPARERSLFRGAVEV